MKNKTDEARDAARNAARNELIERAIKTYRIFDEDMTPVIQATSYAFHAGIAIAESQGGCKWNLEYIDEEELWETACGTCHQFEREDLDKSGFKFCPYCGGKISEPAGSEDK